MRIGHGFDVHRCGPGEHIILGGVVIPWHKGLIAHSDGDVLIHAVCDALLGALAKGDIGRHFPDNDPQFSNIDSRMLLKQVVNLMESDGFGLLNLDTTIVAQAPKLSPFIDAMTGNLAHDLKVNVSQVNVKATTTEHLGYAGRSEGIAAHAVVLLSPL